MGLADEKREPWYNHQEHAKALDRKTGFLRKLENTKGKGSVLTIDTIERCFWRWMVGQI
jgi:hypothetical protein